LPQGFREIAERMKFPLLNAAGVPAMLFDWRRWSVSHVRRLAG
jgi:hypothetical protein